MNIRESELPGIGRKFEITTKSKEKIVIIIHDDGRREVYHFDSKDSDESVSNLTLNDIESRQLAAILGGIFYKPKALETIEMAFDDLIIEWFKVEKDAKANLKTIGELDIRNQYGVTIIALIKKNQEKVLNPGPDEIINENDTIVISGERTQLKTVIKELLTRGG
ncbi:cation:proton antiporter regulatory subunit [Metabacillus arenae]|uniref:Cation:proton antiporter regulatory subunit n=1 Tax=Metabacillus arenae TaxID=2771434 RepID=A0A926S1I5_9BACI|nr:cation:proton antiporter regulatory subunit [Metabacillus arenae]MBD1381049.1 cation:proton antiporter regulatory subunit [Metabacillus arenae]